MPFFGFNTLVGNFNNCLFIGIVACNGTGSPLLTSNISWGNFPNSSGAGDDCLAQVFQGCGSMSNTIAERAWPGTGNSTSNPSFVDAANDDYHLNDDSPAIDRGNPDASPDVDLCGRPRRQGAGPDIGAVKFLP